MNNIDTFIYRSYGEGISSSSFHFLNHYHLSVYDFYGKSGNRSFQRMLVDAGVEDDFYCANEEKIVKRLPKLFYLNSSKLPTFFIRYVEAQGEPEVHDEEEKLMVNMLYYTFFQKDQQRRGLHQ
ncbi:hypothetical protein KFZ58_18685 [Virgibacillus sp. NKC19-16]|uniref:hypothetical protein n=1 Tax=Virgibacillus salidurans TaxID=2831673 RepID=UPI001F29603F|nr:hypothetical protein [Virgibacillus sp. NKC19-16]UJL46344.1 hypothetical protein KFZ58_18685 [Virgibacillus sp. NKC19-16]